MFAVALLGLNAALLLLAYAGGLPAVVAAAVLGPVGLALARRPQRGIMLLALLVPFDGLLLLAPSLPPAAAGWKEALLLATLVATFVAPREARAARPPRPSWAPAVIGLLALAVLSALAVGGLQALWGLKVAFFFVLVVAVLWRCPLDRRERDRLVTALLVVGVIAALYAIAQQAMGHRRLAALGYEYNTVIRYSGGFLRSFSTFTQPFGLGYFLMLVLLVGAAHALGEPRRLRSRAFVLAAPVLAMGLALTFVRGAWVGLAVGLAYLGFTRFRVLLLGLPLAAIALLFLPTEVSSAALAPKSGLQRVEAWQEKLSRITAHPLGVGVGASSSASEKVTEATGTGEIFHPDNQYYKAVYELGVLGLWLLVLLFVAAFASAHARVAASPPSDSLFALSTAAMVLAAAAASFVATYLDIFPMDVYFWLFLAVVHTTPGRPASASP
ncbi:MAG TPA: O-antigen ligase family protein [Acidimicrobiales bacterium]|nr:O-antigen ligase family protein [Acidimicrobiales bacterium]